MNIALLTNSVNKVNQKVKSVSFYDELQGYCCYSWVFLFYQD